jgi:membrane associated rhomboid family serine protease
VLIGINIVAAFLAVFTVSFVESYGFQATNPGLLTIITNQFVHANAVHLMGNMVFLAAVGAAVEIATGSARFTFVYLTSSLFGTVTYWLAMRNTVDGPALIGASGAIAGCATYYSLRYTKLRVPLAPKRSLTVAWITIIWIALQLLGAAVRIGEPIHASGFLAHIGGAVGGLLLGVLFKVPDMGALQLGHEVYDALNDRGPMAQIQHLKNHLLLHPEDLKMHLALANEYRVLGDLQDEKRVLLNLVQKVKGEDLDSVIVRLDEMGGLDGIPPSKRRVLADHASTEAGLKLLWSVAKLPKSDSQRPEALLEIIRIGREHSQEDGRIALELLKADYEMHPTLEIARKRGWLD